MRRRRWARAELAAVAALALGGLAVWPFGAYPVDDDWAFARSLEGLLREGRVEILDWNPMTLVAHLGWGLLFAQVFGFHSAAPKLSTAALAPVEAAALLALLRRCGAREGPLAGVALALLLQPLHFFHAFAYTTDVPLLAWTALALWCSTEGLARTGRASIAWLLLGSAFASLAWLVRQPGILVAAAVLLQLALFERARLRDPRLWASALALPVLSVALFQGWYAWIHGPTEAHLQIRALALAHLRDLSPGEALWSAYVLLAYTAFLLLPLLAAVGHRWPRAARARRAAAALAAGLLAVFLWGHLAEGALFPYLRNKVTPYGFLLPDSLLRGRLPVLWPPGTAHLLGVALLAGALAFALRWMRGVEPAAGEPPAQLAFRQRAVRLAGCLLALDGLYLFATFDTAFDRHLLLALPPALVVLCGALGPRLALRPLPFAACLLPLAWVSVAGTHDVHALSRAAFRTGEALIAQGVPPDRIDAGYAFAGWHTYRRSRRELRGGARPLTRAGDPWYLGRIAPRVLSQYAVSLDAPSATSPYRAVRELPVRTLWPPGTRRLYVLVDRRVPGSPVD